ncbi:MAG: arsenic efflux protein [Firmicutes bacterium]|nr:arsenic efflux protein [Dethiobacter sp.]MBS3888019.1 arsenic efflux protein [Bacillota bacterium]
MIETVWQLVLESMAGAFIDVGAFVGAVLLLFGFINYRKGGAFVATIERSKGWQPVLGALFGLIPGCGGSIFIMPLFIKGTVTFGAVVATLVATTGDSAFVMIATMPVQYVYVSALAFGAAVLTGYLVDRTSLGEKLLRNYRASRLTKKEVEKLHRHVGPHAHAPHIGHGEGDDIDLVLHHQIRGHLPQETLGYRLTHQGFIVFWGLLSVGLVLAVLGLAQVDTDALFFPNFGLLVGVTGAVLSFVLMVFGKKFLDNDTHEETEIKATSLKETFIHNAQETAFVVVWVFVGFLVYELAILLLGRGDYAAGEALLASVLLAAGALSIVMGGLIGLIPGCGPQIMFVTLYSRGLIPFAALLANAISQDGDALFPLMALHRRSALLATTITAIPAILFGFAIYWFELHTNLGLWLNSGLGYLRALLVF